MFPISDLPRELHPDSEPVGLAFLCLAQNCARMLPAFLSYLGRLNETGFRCHAVIGENGSTDATRQILCMAEVPRLHVVDTSVMAGQRSRLARMAVGRQLLLETARDLGINADYVCVADLDNVMAVPPEPAALGIAVARLALDRGIFAVGATSRPVYYDLYSHKSNLYFNPDLPQDIADTKRHPARYYGIHRRHIYPHQRAITGLEPMVCASSFNGFCLYRMSEYLLGTYRSRRESVVCEHVTFNLSLGAADGRHMLIVPELVLRTPEDHAPAGPVRFWLKKMSVGCRRLVFQARGTRAGV